MNKSIDDVSCMACGNKIKHFESIEIDMGLICKKCSNIGKEENGRSSKSSD